MKQQNVNQEGVGRAVSEDSRQSSIQEKLPEKLEDIYYMYIDDNFNRTILICR